MVPSSFEFTKITRETINARTFKCLLKFQHDVTIIKLLGILYETCLNFTLDNCRTRTTILAWITIAGSRHITTFTVIFCNSIFLNTVTSITLAYTVIITRYTTSNQMAGCTVMSFRTFTSWRWNIVNKIDNTSPSILTFINITSIIFTTFTKILRFACATEPTGSFIVGAYSSILWFDQKINK